MRNRDMFYQNAYSAFNMPPNPYMNNFNNPNSLQENNEYEQRISKLERQVNNLDMRLQKLETASIDDKTNNFYMI